MIGFVLSLLMLILSILTAIPEGGGRVEDMMSGFFIAFWLFYTIKYLEKLVIG